ncbi:branched-chain amino acid ABC transporter permease [Tropicibacter naphthalenivorans]|uniref:Branched-chain amino acid transporter permease subunit LivH n=1 Tax=Tropicibacter naphthalenivorans TaxID=441103 RepID=A0A0P1GYA0_9RHOB|nr:branched-chain amino acid ABC transporter permease [Tropicibacter naphthalenivorans]CUH82267.1 branched-chain amino acid transporter permease subunit LivH [Tropicibacter naphthalenivorans]SMD04671.1 amino acid/amide ABC transporter membrane protein 1, HAAT family [Tropicibacter naphthalenivorans]
MQRLLPYLGYLGIMVLAYALFASGKPMKVAGLFLVSGLAVGSLYALGGIGMVVLYRASGVLNLASGAIGALGVMVAWQLQQWGWAQPITWGVAIALAAALSLVYGRLIAPGLAWRAPVVKAVATLGFALVVLGLTAFAWEDDVRKFTLPTDKAAVMILGLRVTVTRLIVVGAAFALVAGIWLYLTKTRTGLQMRALANDRDLSAMIGVNILRVESIAWGIAGVIAGFTGLMFGDLVRLEPVVITFMVIPAVTAAICGRLDNLGLVLMGGLTMGVVESLLTLSPALKSARPVAPFLIAAVVLIVMQRGQRLLFARD